MAVSAEPFHAGAPGATEPAAGQQGRERDWAPSSGREGPTWPCDLGLRLCPFLGFRAPQAGHSGRSEVLPLSHAHSHAPEALNLGHKGVTGTASATLFSPDAADPGAAAGGFHDDP